jgi:hypothetical protein
MLEFLISTALAADMSVPAPASFLRGQEKPWEAPGNPVVALQGAEGARSGPRRLRRRLSFRRETYLSPERQICDSRYSDDKKADLFVSKYKDRQMTMTA